LEGIFLKGKRLIITLWLLFCMALPATGCLPAAKRTAPQGTTGRVYLAVRDDAGRTVILKEKPVRIVPLSASFLELLYAVDGAAVGRSSTRQAYLANVPEEVTALPDVGFVYNINTEKLLSLKPDLVIGHQGINDNLVPILESSGVPVLLVKIRTFEDVKAKLRLFGAIAGTPAKAGQLAGELDGRIKAIVGKMPAKTVKVAILHATARSVTVELENSLAGSVAKILGLRNVAAGSKPLEGNPDATPYSLETLAEKDPDMIFITTMGESRELGKRLQSDVESNPAWRSLRAVKEGRVHLLPNELFLVNPVLRFDDAVRYMAKLVYPGAIGDDK
jgi:iron complex transport system substrate-binding protein